MSVYAFLTEAGEAAEDAKAENKKLEQSRQKFSKPHFRHSSRRGR
jgi:hypothetical protein